MFMLSVQSMHVEESHESLEGTDPSPLQVLQVNTDTSKLLLGVLQWS